MLNDFDFITSRNLHAAKNYQYYNLMILKDSKIVPPCGTLVTSDFQITVADDRIIIMSNRLEQHNRILPSIYSIAVLKIMLIVIFTFAIIIKVFFSTYSYPFPFRKTKLKGNTLLSPAYNCISWHGLRCFSLLRYLSI